MRTNHECSLPSRRRRQIVEIRWKKSELGFVCVPFQVSLKLPGRKACQHFVAFKNKNPSGEKGCARSVEDVAAHIITVRPHADLWIINEVHGIGYEIVKEIRSGGVLCLRDGYALMRKVGTPPNNELRENPASRHNVVRDHWVAVIVQCAISAQLLEKGIAGNGPGQRCARGFIENSETGIVPLNILFRADAAVRIRRVARRDKIGKSHSDTFKIQACWGRR